MKLLHMIDELGFDEFPKAFSSALCAEAIFGLGDEAYRNFSNVVAFGKERLNKLLNVINDDDLREKLKESISHIDVQPETTSTNSCNSAYSDLSLVIYLIFDFIENKYGKEQAAITLNCFISQLAFYGKNKFYDFNRIRQILNKVSKDSKDSPEFEFTTHFIAWGSKFDNPETQLLHKLFDELISISSLNNLDVSPALNEVTDLSIKPLTTIHQRVIDSKLHRLWATKHFATYIYNKLQSSDTDLSSFLLLESSILYQLLKENDALRNKLNSWDRFNRLICDRLINLVGYDEFILSGSRIRVPNSVNQIYYSILLLVTPINRRPYQTLLSLTFALDLLLYLNEIDSSYKSIGTHPDETLCSVNEEYLRRIGFLHVEELLPLNDELRSIVLQNYGEETDLQVLFSKYSVTQIIKLFSNVVCSRFGVYRTKQQIEQFLYEEYAGMIKCVPNVPLCVNVCLDKRPRHIEDQSHIVCIDGPSGPQACLRKLATYSRINPEITTLVQVGIVQNIYERYLSIENLANLNLSKFLNINHHEETELQGLVNLYPSIKKIFHGNLYQDTIQYLTDQFNLRESNKHLEEKQKRIEDLIKLEDKNTEQADFIKLLYAEIDELSNVEKELKSKISTLGDKLNDLNDKLKSFVDNSKYKFHKGPSEDGLILANQLIEKRSLTPTNCLKIVSHLAGSRVVVLKEAFASASKSDQNFKNNERLLNLLCTLVTKYYEQYFSYGDNLARKVFTSKEYAATESETVVNSKSSSIWKDRSVKYGNDFVKMTQHLKIGVEDNLSTTIRVYFFIDQVQKKIVIGYCGQHPKNTKTN